MSVILAVDRLRYSVSKTDTERKTRTASGLTVSPAHEKNRNATHHLPLVFPSVYSIGMHGDFGEEIVEQPKQPGIARAERLLEP